MKDFKFSEKGHRYTLDGKRLTGVTTILNVIAKPALIQWSANMAVDYIEKYFECGVPTMELDKLFKEARNAHRRKKEDAGAKGTDVHALIEDILYWCMKMNGGSLVGYSKELYNEKPKQVQHFINWAITNKVKFLASEKKMYSEKYWIAGTCDFVCEIDKKRMVGDIKTSSGIYDRTPHFQTAGYRLMLEEMGAENIEGSVIVNLKKDGTFTDKDVHYSFDHATDLKGFMSCLELYRALATYKK